MSRKGPSEYCILYREGKDSWFESVIFVWSFDLFIGGACFPSSCRNPQRVFYFISIF
jgi:hypothetical protein